jgi:integrase/recombinase XerD
MTTKTVQNLGILQDYLEIWIENFLKDRKAQSLSKGTVEYYKQKLRVFVEYCNTQEVKLISQITPSLLRDFLLLLSERGHNEGGVHGYFRSTKAFLRWYWEEVEPDYPNPISKVKAPRLPVEPIEGISREDFDTLLSTCRGKLAERDKAILMVLLDTGVRASELCDIRLDDLSFGDSSILIRQGKGKKPRSVFFGKKTRRQIRRYLKFRVSSMLLDR